MGESVIVDDGIFDLFDFGLNFDEELSDAISNSTRPASGSESGSGEDAPGEKADKKVYKSSRPVDKLRAHATASKPKQIKRKSVFNLLKYMGEGITAPARRQKASALLVFPSFDKCDSLLYFPHAFTRFINSSDFTAMYKLMNSHLDRNCTISLGKHVLSLKPFVKFFEMTDKFQPDRIACVHKTTVTENQIKSAVYLKFTDVHAVSKSVVASTGDLPADGPGWCGASRERHWKKKVADSNKPIEEQRRLCALVDQRADLVINVRIDLTITIDDMSKKVKQLQFQKHLLSMHKVECIV